MSGIAINGDVRAYFAYDDEANPGLGIFHPIGQLTNIGGLDNNKDEIDITTLENQSGYREYIPALKEAGSVQLTMLFNKDDYYKIIHDLIPLGRWTYQITLEENALTWATWTFEAEFREIGLTVPVDDKISVEYTLRVSNQIDFVIH